MPEITSQEQKGLLIGSMLSAAINAAAGGSKRESMARGALGMLRSYAGGIDAIYDNKQRDLNMQRQKDLIDIARQKHSWDVADRPGQVASNALALEAAKRRSDWEIADRPGQVEARRLATENAKKNVATGAIELENLKERNARINEYASRGEVTPLQASYLKAPNAGLSYIMPAKEKISKDNIAALVKELADIEKKLTPEGQEAPDVQQAINEYKIKHPLLAEMMPSKKKVEYSSEAKSIMLNRRAQIINILNSNTQYIDQLAKENGVPQGAKYAGIIDGMYTWTGNGLKHQLPIE